MARKPNDKHLAEDKPIKPEAAKQDDGSDAVKDLPPSNKFHEPIDAKYPEGKNAEVNQATLKPAETVVEHPLAPTDSNPNPHGNRDEPFTAVATKGEDGKAEITAPDEGDVEIEGIHDHPVHLGDGRTLAKGHKAKVTKEVAKQLRANKQAK